MPHLNYLPTEYDNFVTIFLPCYDNCGAYIWHNILTKFGETYRRIKCEVPMNQEAATQISTEVTTPAVINPTLRRIIDEVCVGEEFALLRRTLELYAQIDTE